MSIDLKKKHKSVKFDSKDLVEIFSKETPENSPPKLDVSPNLMKSENLNPPAEVAIENNPFIKSAFGKMFNRYHEKKEKETSLVLKSGKTKDFSENEGKSPMLKSLIFKNFKVKDTVIQKDWLKNKANTYDVILLNAFYLVDIKRNLMRTKVAKKNLKINENFYFFVFRRMKEKIFSKFKP